MIDMCKSHKNMPMCLHISGQYFDTESYNVTLSVKLHFFECDINDRIIFSLNVTSRMQHE